MDVKSLAKSKRAHSQHHSKKPHPSQKSKGQSDSSKDPGAGGAKSTISVKQVVEKPHRSRHVPGLPSNWDRYDDDLIPGSEDQSADMPSDVIVPKSKGADYGYLISEAESQSRTASDYFPYLDDVLPGDFHQALGSMLAVRGEEILSWIGNDNFVVDDDTSVNHEAAFLTLNLHALANELDKVDLPTRLFIEPDLLPPELHTEESKPRNNLETDGIQLTNRSEATTRISEKFVTEFGSERNLVNQVKEISISVPIQAEGVTNSSPFGKSNQRKVQKSREDQSKPYTSSASKYKTLIFEATAAEAELDSLLDSFDDSPVESFSVSRSKAFISHSGLTQQAASSTQNFDDVLDDLLGEISNLTNQNKTSQGLDVKEIITTIGTQSSSSSSSHTVTEPKVIDDFDSWLGTL